MRGSGNAKGREEDVSDLGRVFGKHEEGGGDM